ncbi:hypothetical protein AGMMS49992_20850 [Clostridia bacterium]|nr:hypothetical protein AGMMS49992_20850 [Clostridia bacterium]
MIRLGHTQRRTWIVALLLGLILMLGSASATAELQADALPQTLYVNTYRGMHFHVDPECSSISERFFQYVIPFDKSELSQPPYNRLPPCMYCIPEAYSIGAPEPGTPVFVINTEGLGNFNLRAEPSTSAEVIASYREGVEMTVLENTSEEWAKVRVGFEDAGYFEGYVMKHYLSSGSLFHAGQYSFTWEDTVPPSGGCGLYLEPSGTSALVSGSDGEPVHIDETQVLTTLGWAHTIPKANWTQVSAVIHDPAHPRADANGDVVLTGFIERYADAFSRVDFDFSQLYGYYVPEE